MKPTCSLLALCCAALLSSCAGIPQTIPPIPAQEKVAVVTFPLYKTITPRVDEFTSKKETDNTAGLLQKDSSYFADHQAALDSIWSKFNAGLASALKATIVPTAEIVSNPKYSELTTPLVVKVLGMDVTPANQYLEPHGGLRYITYKDTARLRALSEALGVKRLLVVDNNADYYLSTGMYGVGSARMTLQTILWFYEPGKGVYSRTAYRADSKGSAAMVGGTISTSNYPKLLPETADQILVKIAADAARGRGETPAK